MSSKKEIIYLPKLYMIIKKFILYSLLMLSLFDVYAAQVTDTIPTVFMIGEHELEYESLVVECNDILLNVCNDSMDEAYEQWLLMLHNMETYAQEKEIEIRGVKLWLNVFWRPDGSIKNIVFYPKPNCKNMDFQVLTDLLTEFVDGYAFTKTNIECFAHYGSATFPTHSELLFNIDKTDK
jgi:hypothetical protein